jgi:hypothetical protein
VELAARFCTDAMESVYFSWDADRYASRSAHNLARTANQLRLARTLDQRMGKAMQIAAEIGTTHG